MNVQSLKWLSLLNKIKNFCPILCSSWSRMKNESKYNESKNQAYQAVTHFPSSLFNITQRRDITSFWFKVDDIEI